MKIITYAIVIISTLSLPIAGYAGNGKGKNKDGFKVQRVVPSGGSVGHCPPGLAKKAVPCVPPGQVKKLYRVGDRIDRDYDWIYNPNRYGLRQGGHYLRAGDYVYSVNPDTHKVLNLIGAVADILY